MDGLRKINQRRRAFRAQPMKRSRRGFAYGGFVDDNGDQNPEPVEPGRPSPEGNLTVDRPRDYVNTGPSSVELKGFAKGGLRGYQAGGEVEDEEEEPYRLPSGAVAKRPPLTAGKVDMEPLPSSSAAVNLAAEGLRQPTSPESTAPGYQGQMEPLPRMPDPQALRRQNAEARGGEGFVPPMAPGTARGYYNPTNPREPEVAAARAETAGVGGAARAARPSAEIGPYTSDAEAAAKERGELLGAFGLRPGTTRDRMVAGAPRVTRYTDPATGKTLYSNVMRDIGANPTPSPEAVKFAQERAKADADRLTGLIQAKAAAGDPQSIEEARQLAVTPQHKAMIGEAQNLAGLRARARRGDKGALVELQGRNLAAAEGLRSTRALQAAMLAREPTPLQVVQEQRAQRGEARDIERARRESGTKVIQDAITNYFGSDDKGKMAATDFHQSLSQTLPHLKGVGGDVSKLDPNQLSILFALNEYRRNAAPGTLSRFLGATPGSRNLLDFIPKDRADGFWRTQIRTPEGLFTLGELTQGRRDLKETIARLLAQQER